MFDGVFCYPFYFILLKPNVIICDAESTVNVMEGDLMTLHCFYDTNVTPVQFMWLQNNISISYGEGNGSTSIPLQIKGILEANQGLTYVLCGTMSASEVTKFVLLLCVSCEYLSMEKLYLSGGTIGV